MQEPIEGWNDTSLAAVSVIKGMCMGLVRTLNVYPEIPVHTVPADYLVNFTLAAAWKTAQNSSNTTMVYNCTSEGLSCGNNSKVTINFSMRTSSFRKIVGVPGDTLLRISFDEIPMVRLSHFQTKQILAPGLVNLLHIHRLCFRFRIFVYRQPH